MNKLIDYFPDWMTGGGIFTTLNNLPGYTPPWDKDIALYLDMEYFGNRSGSKVTSPLVDRIILNGSISPENVSKLARILVSLYGTNWSKLWETLKFEYDPIENYNMMEDGTETGTVGTVRHNNRSDNTSRNVTRNETITRKGTDTETPAEVVSTAGENTADRTKNVFGFNSDEPGVPAETENGKNKTSETVTHSGTNKNEKDETETQNGGDVETGTLTSDETGGDTRTDDLKHTLNRHGNIGVTTSQQMIQSERELWFWVFFDVVFEDLDKVLTSPIY